MKFVHKSPPEREQLPALRAAVKRPSQNSAHAANLAELLRRLESAGNALTSQAS